MSEDTLVTAMPYHLDGGFVGREAQISSLFEAFRSAVSLRSMQCVSITGATGRGKSRIIKELTKRSSIVAPTARTYVGKPGSAAQPYSAFTQLLMQRLGLTPTASDTEKSDALKRHVDRMAEQSRNPQAFTLLRRLLRLPLPEQNNSIAPHKIDSRMFLAVRDFFAADSEVNPLILAFENIERASKETIQLLQYLRAGLRPYPILLILSGSDDAFEKHPELLGGETPLLQLQLPPLTIEERGALFRRLCGQLDNVPPELQRYAERIGSTPKILKDILRLLMELKIIVPAGTHTWGVDDAKLQLDKLPATYEKLVEARLEVMPKEARTLIEQAAVIGRSFWADALVAVRRGAIPLMEADGPPLEDIIDTADQDHGEVYSALEQLCMGEWISPNAEPQLQGQREYSFKSSYIHSVIKKRLEPATQTLYATSIARWLALRPEGRNADIQERIADYLLVAGKEADAARRYRRAADRARSEFFNKRAISLYQKSLLCTKDHERDMRIHIWHDLGSVHELVGDYGDALDAFEKMLRLSWLLAARSKAAVAFNKMGRIWRKRGNLKASLEYLARGEKLFAQTGDQRGIAGSLDDIAQVLLQVGECNEAMKRASRALAMRRLDGDNRSIAVSLETVASIQKRRGEWDTARRNYRESLDLRNSLNDKLGIGRSMHAIANIDFERGDERSAIDDWKEVLEIAKDIGSPMLRAMGLISLASAHRQKNRHEEGRSYIDEAVEICQKNQRLPELAAGLCELAMCMARTRDLSSAREYAEQALEIAEQSEQPALRAKAHQTLAEILTLNLFDPEKTLAEDNNIALSHFTRALHILEEIDDKFEIALTKESLGKYLIEQNRMNEGIEHLKNARDTYVKLRSSRTTAVDDIIGNR